MRKTLNALLHFFPSAVPPAHSQTTARLEAAIATLESAFVAVQSSLAATQDEATRAQCDVRKRDEELGEARVQVPKALKFGGCLWGLCLWV